MLKMILNELNKIVNTERDVEWGNGRSRRFLIEKDGMGYSLTDTIIDAGTESLLEYTNHLEACYCIDGEGEVEKDGVVYSIKAGTMYALDKHDKHYLRAKTTLRLVCVFSPALKGNESHKLKNNDSSSY
jgi:L-ectoine synthase